MKAIYSPKAGEADVLEYREMDKPKPGNGELLVRVHYGTVTKGDAILRSMPRIVLNIIGAIVGFKAMKIPGVEFSGVVEAAGGDVGEFKPGDEVCGTTTGLAYGANAEYVCVPVISKTGVVIHKPKNLSFKESAAAIVGPMTALQLIKKVEIKPGESVLIYGASGSVGSFALQIAKYMGATVTAVCSTGNIEFVKGLGAEKIIDYKTEDFRTQDTTYDVIFDAVGKINKSGCKKSLSQGGRFVSVKQPTKEVKSELEHVQKLTADGHIVAFIDREFSLEQVPEAHSYVDSGRKRGNVSVRIS